MTTLTREQLLRHYRATAGFTREQLAERSGDSADNISKLERDQRQPPIVAIDRLVAVLGLGAAENQALAAAQTRTIQPLALETEAASAAGANSRRASILPASMTSFVGREQELGAIAALLVCQSVRVLTVTGPGGIG